MRVLLSIVYISTVKLRYLRQIYAAKLSSCTYMLSICFSNNKILIFCSQKLKVIFYYRLIKKAKLRLQGKYLFSLKCMYVTSETQQETLWSKVCFRYK